MKVKDLGPELTRAFWQGPPWIDGPTQRYRITSQGGQRILRIGELTFVGQNYQDRSLYGLLARRLGTCIVWIHKDGKRLREGFLNGKYVEDLPVACEELRLEIVQK